MFLIQDFYFSGALKSYNHTVWYLHFQVECREQTVCFSYFVMSLFPNKNRLSIAIKFEYHFLMALVSFLLCSFPYF